MKELSWKAMLKDLEGAHVEGGRYMGSFIVSLPDTIVWMEGEDTTDKEPTAFGPAPHVCLKRCNCTTLNQIHHAALLHRSGTPFIRCPQTCPFTTQGLMSLPGCCEASTRPHLHTRRSSRLRSSSVGPCGGSVVPEGGEGGAPQGGWAGAWDSVRVWWGDEDRSPGRRGEEAVPVHAQQYQPCLLSWCISDRNGKG